MLLADARFALRNLARSPGFTAIAAITLALGIGATTAMFSAVDALLLRSLPYPDGERLVMLWTDATKRDMPRTEWTNADQARDWAKGLASVESMYAFTGWGPTLTGSGDPDQLDGARVTNTMFATLGVRPALGRGFTAADDVPKGPPVVVVSNGFWQRRLGGDPAAIGRSITLDGAPWTVIGVMPPGFQTPLIADREVWRPLQSEGDDRGGFYLRVVARLAPGVSHAAAQLEFDALQAKLAAAYPADDADLGGYVQPLRDAMSGAVRTQLLVLLGATALVLLIACANVANLLLARATGRAREFALRAALGAGAARLLRQLLTESLVLAALGAVLGLVIAAVLIGWLATQLPSGVAAGAPLALDLRVLAFAVAAALGSGLLFGLAPALGAARRDLAAALREGDRAAAGGRGGRRLRAALVIGNFALALALTVGAGLFLKSLVRLSSVEPGFRAEQLYTFTVALPQAAYPDRPARGAFQDRLRERLAALPGVSAVGFTSTLPLGGDNTDTTIRLDRPGPDGKLPEVRTWYSVASAGYLEAMGVPLLRGRTLDASDRMGAPNAVVINEAFAREHFAGEDPVGRRLAAGPPDQPLWFDIVGVVGDVRFFGLDQPQTPTSYLAAAQRAPGQFFVVLRASGDPLALRDPAARALAELDPSLPFEDGKPMTTLVDDSLRTQRLLSTLTAAFATLSLLLAALGVYGTTANAVASRTRELGVRLALGAKPVQLLAQVMRRGLALAAAGVGLGLLLALALARGVQEILFDVAGFDPLVFAAVSLLLFAVAAVATLLPAWRAARIDPMEALRYE